MLPSLCTHIHCKAVSVLHGNSDVTVATIPLRAKYGKMESNKRREANVVHIAGKRHGLISLDAKPIASSLNLSRKRWKKTFVNQDSLNSVTKFTFSSADSTSDIPFNLCPFVI
uniref:Uncharacterized protein n=1 Tax=Pseudictyota dubia TaxID=2749911 RepID=A0A7R9ZCI6_9STRA|mmetsp:Transcript_41971/g.77706  ORF Transcript_41971/g.77706 Transcript_41971/m.77706 type:complete len:113 (+) Transcript_41971:329-667(+)